MNDFGHKLIKDPYKLATYHCLKCNGVIWKSFKTLLFQVKIADGVWKNDVTCDEMIIKGIIE